MATIGHVVIRNGNRFCYGLTTTAADDMIEFFARVGPHVPDDPAEAFAAYLAWREQVVPTEERLRYPSEHAEGFVFDWDAPTESLNVLEGALEEATRRMAQTSALDVDAYLIGYGHSSLHLLVDLAERKSYMFDSAGKGEMLPIEETAAYAYHHRGRERYFTHYPPPVAGALELPVPRVTLDSRWTRLRSNANLSLGRDSELQERLMAAARGDGPPVDEKHNGVRYTGVPGFIGVGTDNSPAKVWPPPDPRRPQRKRKR